MSDYDYSNPKPNIGRAKSVPHIPNYDAVLIRLEEKLDHIIKLLQQVHGVDLGGP